MSTQGKIRPRKRGENDLSHRPYDILGIVFVALGIVTIVSLLVPETGLIGRSLGSAVRVLFGTGGWIAPPCLILIGVALIAGKRKVEVTHLGIGLTVILLAILGIMAGARNGDYFDIEAASKTGGYLGAILGWLFDTLLGRAKMVGLGAMVAAGLILCVPVPIRALFHHLKSRAADAAAERKQLQKAQSRSVVVVEQPQHRYHEAEEDEHVLIEDTKPAKLKVKPIIREHEVSRGEEPAPPAEGYRLPPTTLLTEGPTKAKRSQQEMQRNIDTLESTLEEFGIDASVVEIATGPTVTRYEIQLGPGIRVARITALADNVAMNLAASHVRVEAPIPGKAAIGVEVPNTSPSMVTLREVVEQKEFRDSPSRLMFALGLDVSGLAKYADLAQMPHLLIGGATNSGKSIGLASLIMSLLMRNTPKDVKFVMIDPKRVELSLFDGIPHLMCPVVRDVKEAPGVLRAVWREMDIRYDLLAERNIRNIEGWNAQATFQERMPYIVVVIDELADLMIQAKAEVETSIVRLAQLARAVGIHLVIATQRPSVDVITGIIKANVPSRIAFSVSSQVDSRTILDGKGAEDLIGKGDLLFLPINLGKPVRMQGCYVSEKEIDAVCKFWREQEKPAYVLTPLIESGSREDGGGGGESSMENDPLWEDAVRWVVERGQASTSMLQRRFSIGFQRASRLLDSMEERGVVGPRDGPRPREVLVDLSDLDVVMGRNVVPPNAGIREELLDDE